jgi:hypothetical protein
MKHFILGFILFFNSSIALAYHCPLDAKAIDSGLAKVQNLTDDQKAEIIKLRNLGLEQHKAGDHKASADTLAKAMRKLLTDMK